MRIGAIVQVRMGSRRLPGKVLADLEGRPMLAQILRRLKQTPSLDRVGVATSQDIGDDAVEALCRAERVSCFRADDVDDVLARFVACARSWELDGVIRVTGDCPFVCPEAVDQLARGLRDQQADTATFDRRTLHIGIDPFSRSVLEQFHDNGATVEEREHLALLVDHHPERFRVATVPGNPLHDQRRHWQLSVDEPRDLEFARAVYRELDGGENLFSTDQLIELLERKPELAHINAPLQRSSQAESCTQAGSACSS